MLFILAATFCSVNAEYENVNTKERDGTASAIVNQLQKHNRFIISFYPQFQKYYFLISFYHSMINKSVKKAES